MMADENVLEVKATDGNKGQGEQKKPPEWVSKITGVSIPEKFLREKPEETMAELVKANDELQKKLVERKAPPEPKAGEPKADPTSPLTLTPGSIDDDGVDEKIAKAGLKRSDLEAKYLSGGKLDDTDYAALGKQGLGRKLVDEMIRGIAAGESIKIQLVQAVQARVEAAVGGKQQHDNLRQWAEKNIDAKEIEQHNARIRSDPAYYETFMEIVQARYDKKNGTAGSRPIVTGGAPAPTTAGKITNVVSLSETYAKAMRGDPEAQAAILNLSDQERDALKRAR